jgi:hypothetical protein
MNSRIRSFRTHRELERLQFDFFPVGHKEGELYVRMLNKQAAEPSEHFHTVLDDG